VCKRRAHLHFSARVIMSRPTQSDSADVSINDIYKMKSLAEWPRKNAKNAKNAKQAVSLCSLRSFAATPGGMHEVQLKAEKPKVCNRRAHLHFSAFLSRFSAFQHFSFSPQITVAQNIQKGYGGYGISGRLRLRVIMSRQNHRQNQSDSADAPLSPAQRRYLVFTAAMSGAAIMIVEILGAKMLTPALPA
jgi:hypothetical protein